ncbi:ROK family transcriptional regulator [Consotaella aegiceratis]|uniref:ROK family transcriptional regulator n=1 Tax=Consotaella aegiceratis TaxID=3097961 RepID=UPI002F3E2F3A
MSKRNGSSKTSISRRYNRFKIIEFIRRSEETTPSEISSKLEISLPTVVRILSDLMAERLVENVGRESSSIGRPATRVRFRGDAYAIIAVHAHISGFYGVLSDLNGGVLCELRCDTSRDSEKNLAALVSLIGSLHAEPLPAGCSLCGIGVGVQSMVRQPEGLVVLTARLGWKSLPLRDLLQAEFNEPVFVDSDRHLAVVGEWTFGAGRHVDNLVRLSVGPGASAGIMVGGEVYRGGSDAAGELKWFLDDPRLGGHRLPLLGDRQSLRFDQGIPENAFVALEEVSRDYQEGKITVEAFDGVFSSNERLELVRQLLDYATMAATSVTAILNPTTVVLSGSITRGGSFVADVLRHRLGGDVYIVPQIVLSQLGLRAVTLGAVKMVLDATALQPATA